MNTKLISVTILLNLTLTLFVTAPAVDGQLFSSSSSSSQVANPASNDARAPPQSISQTGKHVIPTPSLFARILQQPPLSKSPAISSATVGHRNGTSSQTIDKQNEVDTGEDNGDDDNDDDNDEDTDGEEEEDESDADDDDGDDEEVAADDKSIQKMISKPDAKTVTDIFGNKIKLAANQTQVIRQSKARDLGLLTLKALILGPLIGLTIKAALIRGIFYALFAYALHLFVPGLLGTLGLGTGLVGFARQLQPNYAQMLLPHLANIPNSLPNSFTRLASQYQQIISPVVESIRAIPEGHCRFRAVCETGSQLVRNARSMSSSLQRISATVYMNFGSDYAKAWLDGIVQSDCALKYAQCPASPFSLVAAKLAQSLGARQSIMLATATSGAEALAQSPLNAATVPTDTAAASVPVAAQ